MVRIKFKRGEQRKFLKNVLEKTHCPSLRSFLQFGFDIPYSTLKNYYNESRTLPKNFFEDLCYLSKINVKSLDIDYFDENWGKVYGGKKSRRGVSK
jgi:hypothetical protein